MQAGINQWAFPAEVSTKEALTRARRAGFNAFEPCVGVSTQVPLEATEAEVTALRRHAESEGIAVSSLANGMGWQYPFSSLDAALRDEGIAIARKSLRIAKWLGADTLLIVPGVVTPEVAYDTALERARDAIRALVPEAEACGVTIGIENVWNKLLLSPVEMRDFIDSFASARVGAYFDTGNIVLYGYPEQWIRILGARIRKVHLKDFRANVGNLDGFVMLLEGDVNWPATMRALRETGYDGPLIAEFGPYPHGADTVLAHAAASLKHIVQMAG